MNEEYPTRLSHILDACNELQKITQNISFEKFNSEKNLIYASSFLFIVIGEAASYIQNELNENLSSFPWNKIIGMRHRIAHGYFSIDHEIIWRTIVEDIPNLQKNVKKTLDAFKE